MVIKESPYNLVLYGDINTATYLRRLAMSENSMNNSLISVNNFDFNAEHNGIQCAKMLNAERSCDRVWFSAKQLETWSEMSKTTLWRWLERLEKARRISTVSDMKQWSIKHKHGGSTPTTLYNLNVLNQLAMVCIDNEKLNEISSKFSDILSEVETTGKYVNNEQHIQNEQLQIPQTYSDALRLAADLWDKTQRVTKALEDEKEQHKKDNEDFCEYVDILNQKKTEISTRREATAMNTASQKSKECKRLTVENNRLTNENNNLETENEELKVQVGNAKNLKAVKCIPWLKDFFYFINRSQWNTTLGLIGKQIKKICINNGYKFEEINDSNYGKVLAYDIRAIDIFRGKLLSDKQYMQKYRIPEDNQKSLF